MTAELLLETSSLSVPGADRGLGRYTRCFKSAYEGMDDLRVIEVMSESPVSRSVELAKANSAKSAPFHATSAFGLPVLKSRPWICSIQDIIPLDLDEYSNFGIKSKLAFANARRSDIIVANSNYTAARIMARLKIPSNKIVKISLPVEETFYQIQRSKTKRAPYVSALVDLRARDSRKRPHWLGPIAEHLSRIGIQLRVAGRGLERLAEFAPLAVPVDTPNDSDLAVFYARSLGFLYTSAYEGQGLPPLEAMATGTPVIAFANTSITEMIGNGQILIDDPVPWKQQNLERPIPKHALSEVVDCVKSLNRRDTFWDSCSESASRRAGDFTSDRFMQEVRELILRVETI